MSLVGKPAPDFRMESTKNIDTLDEPVALEDYSGRWLVLMFYPADFTFVCPTEVVAFSAATETLAALGCDLVGISTDSVYSHQAWMEFHVGPLSFPLAADRTGSVSRAYGVLDEETGNSGRALFIVDPDGVVCYQLEHADKVGRSVEETIRVVSALQQKGRTPANWTPQLITNDTDAGQQLAA